MSAIGNAWDCYDAKKGDAELLYRLHEWVLFYHNCDERPALEFCELTKYEQLEAGLNGEEPETHSMETITFKEDDYLLIEYLQGNPIPLETKCKLDGYRLVNYIQITPANTGWYFK